MSRTINNGIKQITDVNVMNKIYEEETINLKDVNLITHDLACLMPDPLAKIPPTIDQVTIQHSEIYHMG